MIHCSDCGEDKFEHQMAVISGNRGICDPCMRVERHDNNYHARNPDPLCPACRLPSAPPFSIKSIEEGAREVLKAIEKSEKKQKEQNG